MKKRIITDECHELFIGGPIKEISKTTLIQLKRVQNKDMKVDDSRMDNRKILRLTSESGDDYSFRIKIGTTDDELEKLLRQELPDEWVENEDGKYDGPGFRGSYLYIIEEDEPTDLN